MEKQNSLGTVSVLGASTLWAIAANVANSLFRNGVTPFELAGISAIIATVLLIGINLFFHQPILIRPSLSQLGLSFLFVLFVAVDYLAIQRLPVAVAIVLIFMAPGFVVLWKALLSKRVPSLGILLPLILSFVGVVMVSELFGSDSHHVNWFGISVGLLTALFFATYSILSEKIGVKATPINSLLQTLSLASLIWLGFLLTQGLSIHLLNLNNAPKILYMGLFGTLLPYLLFLWGIRYLRSEKAAIIASIEPFIAGLIAWVWFGQHLTPIQIIGGILIVVAIVYLQQSNHIQNISQARHS